MTGHDENAGLGDSPVEKAVHQLLRRLGELLPETAEDVAASEDRFKGDPNELPESLRDPEAILGRKVNLKLPPVQTSGPAIDISVVNGLRAAARNGAISSEEIERRIADDLDDDDEPK